MRSILMRLLGSVWTVRTLVFGAAAFAAVLADRLWERIANFGASHAWNDWLIENVLIAPSWTIATIAFLGILAAGLLWRATSLERGQGPAIAASIVHSRGAAMSQLRLRLHNRGGTALTSCRVQVEAFGDGHDSNGLPRLLQTEQQARDGDGGPFALGPGESVNILFCQRRVCDPATAPDPITLAYAKAGPFADLPAGTPTTVTIGIHGGRAPLLQRYRLFVDRDGQLDASRSF